MNTRRCVHKLWLVSLVGLFLLVANAQAQGGLSVSPASLDFGSQPVGATTPPVAVTLTNIDATRTFTIVNVFSTAGPFSVSGPALPVTMQPGDTLTMNVTFTASSAQAFSGKFGFTTYYNWKISVALAGTGIPPETQAPPPQLSVAPSSLDFGTVQAPLIETATLSNTGPTDVTISGVTASDPSMTPVGVFPGMVIAAGQTASLAVVFSPSSAGSVSGAITIGSNATNPSLVIPFSGTLSSASGASASGGLAGTITPVSGSASGSAGAASASGSTSAATGSSATSAGASASPASPASPSVTLSWTPSVSDGVIGYNVYRGTVSGGPYALLTPVPVASPSYTDASVISSQTFYYVVTSVATGNLEGTDSSEVSATIP